MDGVGTAASFNIPDGIAVDAIGNIYVAEYGSNKIRQMTTTGVVTTLAGSGSTGSVDGTGPSAGFSRPAGLAVESIGNVYVADQVNNKIRKIAGVFSINVSKLSGDLQAVDQHASLALPFKVLITDAQNCPVAKIPVTFSALTGYFSKNPYTVNSGADGIATLQPLTVGGQNYGYVQKGFGYFHTTGLQQVYATALGFSTTVFNVNVTPSIHVYDGYYLCPTSGGLLIDNKFEIIDGSITKQNLFGSGRYVGFSELDGSFTGAVGSNYHSNYYGQI